MLYQFLKLYVQDPENEDAWDITGSLWYNIGLHYSFRSTDCEASWPRARVLGFIFYRLRVAYLDLFAYEPEKSFQSLRSFLSDVSDNFLMKIGYKIMSIIILILIAQ